MNSVFLPVIDNGMGLSRTSWAISMCALFLSDVFKDREVSIQALSYPYPDGAMNIATGDFLNSKYDEMLVIDTDLKFYPEHVRRLLAHDVPLVAGLYPKKEPGLNFPIVTLESNPQPFDKNAAPLCEVECIARGFMRIHRSVFESLKPHVRKYPCYENGRDEWEFWRTQVGANSEDFNFCRLYRSIGGKILVDQRVVVEHIGSATYPIKETLLNADRSKSN